MLRERCEGYKDHIGKFPDIKRIQAKVQIYEQGLE
jgi:hypothetical protein